ncbi:MAG: NupC/NupG family nucleoside CNT transporter [Pirellula sp.]|nr:NupC/NupG family nucleoside CNT transporter [Pirellula sp.]
MHSSSESSAPTDKTTASTKTAGRNIPNLEPTPVIWRVLIGFSIGLLACAGYAAQSSIGTRGQAAIGIVFFFGLVAMFSVNLRAVRWKTIYWGIALQFFLAFLVLRGEMKIGDTTYSVYGAFEGLGEVVKSFIAFSDAGAEFVFGNLARVDHMAGTFGDKFLFPFAFKALPPILFVSAFFTLLYHYGVLQWCVRVLARVMVYLMGTSGAETLSVSANVFMGQTEAPLIVKPYVPRMTNSELFALMTSGMAHISGGMMAVYINYGANPVAVLTTCIMACPCSLYLSKLFMPEVDVPETSGTTSIEKTKSSYVNGIDAIVAGTTDGLRLALNVAAMLIVFVAFVAMIDGLLGLVPTGWFQQQLSLRWIFGQLFSPVAFLMGIESADQSAVGQLLGTKLAINEHMAYLDMKQLKETPGAMSDRSYQLAAFALTGFANFSSVGIQLGGIGAMAPDRRSDLAKLGMRALFVGFVATLLNAAIAGLFL